MWKRALESLFIGSLVPGIVARPYLAQEAPRGGEFTAGIPTACPSLSSHCLVGPGTSKAALASFKPTFRPEGNTPACYTPGGESRNCFYGGCVCLNFSETAFREHASPCLLSLRFNYKCFGV